MMQAKVKVVEYLDTERFVSVFGLRVHTGDGKPKRVVDGSPLELTLFPTKEAALAARADMQKRMRATHRQETE